MEKSADRFFGYVTYAHFMCIVKNDIKCIIMKMEFYTLFPLRNIYYKFFYNILFEIIT